MQQLAADDDALHVRRALVDLRYPNVAASGRREIVSDRGINSELWIIDLQTRVSTLFNVEGVGVDGDWMDDDQYIHFASTRAGPWDIYRKRADGLGPVQLLV